MPAAWVGAAVAVAGAYNSYEQGQEAQDAADRQNDLVAGSARDREERFNEFYSPLERQITEEAAKGYTPDYTGRAARINADVAAAFDQTREIGNRARSRYGIGEAADYNKDIDIARALSQVDATNRAYTDERNRADTLGFDRQYKVLQLGYGLPSEATGLYQQQAASNSNQAAAYGRDAAAGIGAAGNFAARAIGSYNQSSSVPTQTSPAISSGGGEVAPLNAYGSAEPIMGYGSGAATYPYGSNAGTTPDYSIYGGYGSYGYAEGGPVVARTPREALEVDGIDARLTDGEFVNDPDTVAYYGLKHFHDLKMKAKQGMQQIYGGGGAEAPARG